MIIIHTHFTSIHTQHFIELAQVQLTLTATLIEQLGSNKLIGPLTIIIENRLNHQLTTTKLNYSQVCNMIVKNES